MTSSAGTRRRHVARFTAPSPPCGLSSRCIPSSQCHRCTVGVGDRRSSAEVFKRSVTLVTVVVTLMSCAACSPLGDGELTAASKSGSQKYSDRATKYNDSRRDIQQWKVVSNDVSISLQFIGQLLRNRMAFLAFSQSKHRLKPLIIMANKIVEIPSTYLVNLVTCKFKVYIITFLYQWNCVPNLRLCKNTSDDCKIYCVLIGDALRNLTTRAFTRRILLFDFCRMHRSLRPSNVAVNSSITLTRGFARRLLVGNLLF